MSRTTEEKLAELIREVERYTTKPGCNATARKTAMMRLRWALDRAREDDAET